MMVPIERLPVDLAAGLSPAGRRAFWAPCLLGPVEMTHESRARYGGNSPHNSFAPLGSGRFVTGVLLILCFFVSCVFIQPNIEAVGQQRVAMLWPFQDQIGHRGIYLQMWVRSQSNAVHFVACRLVRRL